MVEATQRVKASGTLLDCRPLGDQGQLQVLLKANPTWILMSFVVKAGVITIDELRDLLGLPVSLALQDNVVVEID